ncbi:MULTISPECIES: glycosyltransferase [Paraliobacillus]|uniref:glycosyltransferase n=1 Tax=Paraliobacillus TaxID=200903 RepID=UPI000DD46A9A|nr:MULTISPECIES: glycosyltransferase [Paraliobacillus]
MNKVTILFYIYQMGAGGAARTLLNIINNLDRDKFNPIIVTLNYEGSYESELKEDVKFIKLDTKRLSRSIFKLAKIIRNERVNIVFSTIPRVNTIAILANTLSFSGAKNVIREADNLGGTFKENIQLIGFGFIYKFAKQIISLSEGVKQNLVNRYKIKPDDIKVIYNPIDLKNVNEKMNEEIDPLFTEIFNTNEKVIITAGRLVPQKDQHTLLRAFATVNKQIKSRLVILGEGPLEEELMDLASTLAVADRVHFIGFQRNPYSYFKKADLFVLSSIHEGFSHVIAEALATGTLVVSTDCKSGPREVLDNGKYGRLCEVGSDNDMSNQIIQLLSLEKEELNRVIDKGYQRARFFDAKDIVSKYEKAFLATLNLQDHKTEG